MSLDLIAIPSRQVDEERRCPIAPLSLQGTDIELDTPADVHRSGNSIYTCLVMSAFSVGC